MRVRVIGGDGGVSVGFQATSYLIDDQLLIDAGSCASAMEIEDQKKINYILISHPHLDHIKDLAFICDNCFGLRDVPFLTYLHPTSKKAVEDHLFNELIWPDFTKLPTPQRPTMKFLTFKTQEEFQQGGYSILPIPVSHPSDAHGFIIRKGNCSLLFTQDTGPTDLIWEYGKKEKNLKAIFCEVSFPNKLERVAIDSFHHTASTLKKEIGKMPKDIPIYLGHLKPNYQNLLIDEIKSLNEPRLKILKSGVTDLKF